MVFEKDASIPTIARQLRYIAVDEWMKHSEEYQHFLSEDYTVEEAPQFLQQGHFFGPLGNTMVVAISNALGLPVVFSSNAHCPVINITPRACAAAIPLYVAFNHIGAGHYDAVSIANNQQSISDVSHPEKSAQAHNNIMCTCGKGDKHYSITKRCTTMKFKYTTTIRCPCLSAGRPCTTLCICHNCCNPKGVRPTNSPVKMRKRSKHVWHTRSTKSVEFIQEQEKTVTGPRTLLEYLLVSQLIKYCRNDGTDISLDTVSMLYTLCVEVAQALEMHLPLGQKSSDDVSKIILEYEHNLKVLEAMCITQFQSNTE